MNAVIKQLATFLEENKTERAKEFAEKLFVNSIDATQRIERWERRTGKKYSSQHVWELR